MYKLILTMLFCLCSALLPAQTKYTERIQSNRSGGGQLTLHQSQTITDLVNGPSNAQPAKKPVTTPAATPTTPAAKEQSAEPVVDASGQKMRVNGYRIQVYSGNNSRQSKNEAAAMGRRVKSYFDELPVYTNFVSPHWICRTGDFRTYEEASDYLKRMNETGRFPEAVIVRSKITLYY